MTKVCNKCKTEKDSAEFYVRRPVRGTRQKSTGLQSSCKSCQNSRRGDFAYAGPLSQRKSNLRKAYGLTLDQFNGMVAKQQGNCLICGRHKGDSLSVDHDHLTGKIRGLLCNTCNSGLGMFKESPELFDRAVKYLRGEKL